MSPIAFALLVALGLGVGAVGTLVGAGGGFLLAPILLLVYPHDSPQTLTSISLAAVWVNSTSGSIAYARLRRIDVRSGLVFGAATLPGAVGGALAVGYVPRRAFDALMAATLGAVAVWIGLHHERPHVADRGTERVLVDGVQDLEYDPELATVYTDAGMLASVRDALQAGGVKISDAYLGMRAKTKIELRGDDLAAALAFLEAFDEHEDVQRVFGNLDVSDVSLEALTCSG